METRYPLSNYFTRPFQWLGLVLTLFIAGPLSGQIIYVDINAVGTEDGSSWTHAYTDLQDALGAASPGTDIYIAEGTYIPHLTAQLISFDIPAGTNLYGGFPSGGSSFDERDWVNYETILSGDINTPNDNTDNSYHVITTIHNTTGNIIDGLIIEDGNADDAGYEGNGGGWLHRGDGVISTVTPIVRNCIFRNNTAIDGGAIYTTGAAQGNGSIHLINCRFENNTVTGNGGSIYINGTNMGLLIDINIINCIFSSNLATANGGVAYINADQTANIDLNIVNTVMYNNSAATGSVVYSNMTTSGMPMQNYLNSIFLDNSGEPFGESGTGGTTNISYSIFDGTSWGVSLATDNNNQNNTDPELVNPAGGNFYPLPNSPVIDAGDPATDLSPFYMENGEALDIALATRSQDGGIDIGALEFISTRLLNCKQVIPGIDLNGEIAVTVREIASSANTLPEHNVAVKNGWGGIIWSAEGLTGDDYILPNFDICPYFGKTLTVEITNPLGMCTGRLKITETPPVGLTSRLADGQSASMYNLPTADISNGKLVTYCGYVPSPNQHIPHVTVPCENSLGVGYYGLSPQPDWIMPIDCDEENDTAEIIYRTWEVFNKIDQITTITDTIIVLRLPAFAPESIIGYGEDTVFCEIEGDIAIGEALKQYESWGQNLGLHDYELPKTKLQGVIYDLPVSAIAASYANAAANDPSVLNKYLDCVILKKANGTTYTIEDIITNQYFDDLINNLTLSQLPYQSRLESYDVVNIPSTGYNYRPIILLQVGDQILSENGFFSTVTEDWFYNGSGKAPYWLAASWPWVYGNGDCVNYCDVASDGLNGCDVVVLVPALEDEISDHYPTGNMELGVPAGCVMLCLEDLADKPHCSITLVTEAQDWTSQCPASKGKEILVKQRCWANGENAPEPCVWDFYEDALANDNLAVNMALSDFDPSDGIIEIAISQWLSLLDTIGPIFDFCYPISNTIDATNLPCHINPCGNLEWEHEIRYISVAEDFQIFDQPIGTIASKTQYDNASPEVKALFVPYPSVIESHIRAGTQYESARRWEECNPTIYNTSSHDCAAYVFVPSITVKDNCTGVHSVKVKVEDRSIELTKVNEDEDGYVTFAHLTNPFKVPFKGHGYLTEVVYEAADSCWNQSTWTKYITVKDETKPIVSTDDDVRVSLNAKEVWVNAESFNEGSWDNCGIELVLARRADWYTDTACVKVCNDITYTNWLDLLEDLGFNRSEMKIVLDGSYLCGDYSYDITQLKNFLDLPNVEEHYYEKLVWLWEDSYACGEMIIHGWIYDIAKLILQGYCGPLSPLNIEDLQVFLDRIVGKTGYGHQISELGGGWSTAVPFKCTDVCVDPLVEVLVVDYWCNWQTGHAYANVEDKSQAIEYIPLEDVWLSCESYNENYKSLFEKAAAYGSEGSSADGAASVFESIDQIFGYYVEAWKNKNLQVVDENGNKINPKDHKFTYTNIECKEKETITKVADTLHTGYIDWIEVVETETVLEEKTVEGQLGIMTILCSMRNVHQDVWIDLDECGVGKITRRFSMQGGCDPKAPVYIFEQVIFVEATCPVQLSMFDLPEEKYTKQNPICVPDLENAANFLAPDLTGELVLKPSLEGRICNALAIAEKKATVYEIVQTQADTEQLYKLIRIWNIKDWCSKEQFDYEQVIVFRVDPNCAIDIPNDEEVIIDGIISTPNGDPIESVAIEANLKNATPITSLTSNTGKYAFSIPKMTPLEIIPMKNDDHANGISTGDVISIQAHILGKKLIKDQYNLIAADVNNDGQINGLDVLETRRIVLKPNSEFMANTSWRFFLNDGTMSEKGIIASALTNQSLDFTGVKIGDVNQSSNPSNAARSKQTSWLLAMENPYMEAGRTYAIAVSAAEYAHIQGFQYTLAYQSNAVEIVDYLPGKINLRKEHYQAYIPGYITTSWSDGTTLNLTPAETLYTLVVEAHQSGHFRDFVQINSQVIPAEAYLPNDELKNIRVNFLKEENGFTLYQNQPNPFHQFTNIGFDLPKESAVELTIYDVTGKVIYQKEGNYTQGHHEITVRHKDLNTTGILYYQLDAGDFSATKKMIVIQ